MIQPYDYKRSDILDNLDLIHRYEVATTAIEDLTIHRENSIQMNRMYAQLILALQRKISFHQELLQRATNTN